MDRLVAVELPGAPAIPGLRVRNYVGSDDLPAVVEVMHAGRRADGVDWLPSLEEMRTEFANLVNETPERDMLVVEVDGRIVAFVRASWGIRDGAYIYRTAGEVHPDVRRRGIGRALLQAGQARLRDIAAKHPRDVERRFGTETMDGEVGAKALLSSDGYQPIRFFNEMLRPLSEPIPDLRLPDGLEMRPVREADHLRIFEAEAEAFRDHWGYREWTEADFTRTFTYPDLDTALWRVVWEGDEVAAVTETNIHRTENETLGVRHGWLERISVRRPWRGRGVAKAMIVSAMHALRDRGMDQAALGVDAANPTGAFGLYESLGFRAVHGMEVLARPFDE
jgi:mycothiol synthase